MNTLTCTLYMQLKFTCMNHINNIYQINLDESKKNS